MSKALFYNTINLSGSELKDAIISNAKQEVKVQRFLETNKGNFSAWDLVDKPEFFGVPITSIRRALHNLAGANKIAKRGMVRGNYNKPVNTYCGANWINQN